MKEQENRHHDISETRLNRHHRRGLDFVRNCLCRIVWPVVGVIVFLILFWGFVAWILWAGSSSSSRSWF